MEQIQYSDRSAIGSGQSAWITGAARGIGRSIAIELARRSFVVWMTDVDADGLGASCQEIRAQGGVCFTRVCDVSDPIEVEETTTEIFATVGRIDVLVNNAGVVHIDELLDLSFETWRRVLSVNADGAFLVGQAVARRMVLQTVSPSLERRGLIVNVGSPTAEVGRPPRAAYGASKAVVKHLTMTQALALRQHQVAAVLLYPGQVVDGMMRQVMDETALMEGRSSTEVEDEKTKTIPAGKFQTPEEVGAMAAFLACSVGMGITGKLLWCDAHLQNL